VWLATREPAAYPSKLFHFKEIGIGSQNANSRRRTLRGSHDAADVRGSSAMNTTLQLGQLAVATLASAAVALGIDWALLCAAFRLMKSAPAQWRGAPKTQNVSRETFFG
jgi:hypothetical protein